VLDAFGAPFSLDAKYPRVCCLVCLLNPAKDPTFAFRGDAGNLGRHVERLHPTLYAAEEARIERLRAPPARPAAADNPLGFRVVPKPAEAELTVRKAVIVFTHQQCVRLLVVAMLITHRAVNMLKCPLLRRALLAMSGGTFLAPCEETVTKVEKEVQKEARVNIRERFKKDGVIGADGKAAPSVAPRVSIGLDASSTQIDGAWALGRTCDAHERVLLRVRFNVCALLPRCVSQATRPWR
jgi:hypothetical protein